MNERPPFRQLKLQWMQMLCEDRHLSDGARCLAQIIILKYINNETEKAWPSYSLLADDLGKSTKTIQRAVKELEERNWFNVQRGNIAGRMTTFRPTEASIIKAYEAYKKLDDVGSGKSEKGGQIRPGKRTKKSGGVGQNRPLNLEKEPKKEPNAHAHSRSKSSPCHPKIFVRQSEGCVIDRWEKWLQKNDLPRLDSIEAIYCEHPEPGFWLPCRWILDADRKMQEVALQYIRLRVHH